MEKSERSQILERLAKLWDENPEQRLGQLLLNLTRGEGSDNAWVGRLWEARDPTAFPLQFPDLADLDEARLISAISYELEALRSLYPDPAFLTLEVQRRAGILAGAVLSEQTADVRAKAVKLAAIALRLVVEGDPVTDGIRTQRRLGKLGPDAPNN